MIFVSLSTSIGQLIRINFLLSFFLKSNDVCHHIPSIKVSEELLYRPQSFQNLFLSFRLVFILYFPTLIFTGSVIFEMNHYHQSKKIDR